jgi:hypothetical protein
MDGGVGLIILAPFPREPKLSCTAVTPVLPSFLFPAPYKFSRERSPRGMPALLGDQAAQVCVPGEAFGFRARVGNKAFRIKLFGYVHAHVRAHVEEPEEEEELRVKRGGW